MNHEIEEHRLAQEHVTNIKFFKAQNLKPPQYANWLTFIRSASNVCTILAFIADYGIDQVKLQNENKSHLNNYQPCVYQLNLQFLASFINMFTI